MPRPIRILSLGGGLHFKETYSHALARPELDHVAELAAIFDLEGSVERARQFALAAGHTDARVVEVAQFDGPTMSQTVRRDLDAALAVVGPIDAVLVSTTPEVHRAYCEWALGHGLDVLLDKPVTTRPRACFDPSQAKGIEEDYRAIAKLAARSGRLVLVNVHRRYHPSYLLVADLLREVSGQMPAAVTAMNSFCSDGQWRLPDELVELDYHGYQTGTGVISHFGYHFLDMAALWYEAGTVAEKQADEVSVRSDFVLVDGHLDHSTHADLTAVFGEPYARLPHRTLEQVRDEVAGFGEVDANIGITLHREGRDVGLMTMQFTHSGFSQRTWPEPVLENLYKKNGRVRFENHLIQQGPYQAISVQSFQALQFDHGPSAIPRFDLGGADHLERAVLRNGLTGLAPVEHFSTDDLVGHIPDNNVVHEHVKSNVLVQFVSAGAALREPTLLDSEQLAMAQAYLADEPARRSDISTHAAGAKLMSLAYQAHSQKHVGMPPVASSPIVWPSFGPGALADSCELL